MLESEKVMFKDLNKVLQTVVVFGYVLLGFYCLTLIVEIIKLLVSN